MDVFFNLYCPKSRQLLLIKCSVEILHIFVDMTLLCHEYFLVLTDFEAFLCIIDRYLESLLRRVSTSSVCYSPSRKSFVSHHTLAFKAEVYSDPQGMLFPILMYDVRLVICLEVDLKPVLEHCAIVLLCMNYYAHRFLRLYSYANISCFSMLVITSYCWHIGL